MSRPIPFGKYYLLERINVGGMAEVFRAKAYGVEGFERLLAVKKILPNIAADEEFIEMFIDEAKIAVQLNHANIAQIFDLGKVEKAYFIALEYVHGKDLRAIFDRTRALSEMMPVPQACFVVMKICEGLDYAHNKRDRQGREMHLVHRDVSPQNILVSYDGEVKLVDFGIAKAAGKASKTQAGILKGKFGYMSPEQVRGLPLDRRSDIFSVGIILYELLTAERLFLGETDFATLEKVRNVEILPPSTYNRKVSDELEQIAMRALARDVDDRYQNAIDLHDDLQAYMYTSGEFYSRKDLAAWMKRTFAREIEEEGRKLEAYREMPIPVAPSSDDAIPTEPGRPLRGGAATEDSSDLEPADREPGGTPRPPRRPGVEMAPEPESPIKGPDLSWDDDEVDTEIYDKPEGDDSLDVAPGPDKPGSGEPIVVAPPPRSGGQTGPSQPVLEFPQEMPRVPVLRSREPQPAPSRGGWFALVALLLAMTVGGAAFYYLVYAKRPGQISVISTPAQVELFLDGRRRARRMSPFSIDGVAPGFHVLVARRNGYQQWEQTVEVKAGAGTSVTVQLVALPSVELRTVPPGAEVRLDGKKLGGVTPMRITQLAPGRHRLELRSPPKYQPRTADFEVRPGQVLQLKLQLLPAKVSVTFKSDPAGAVAFVSEAGGAERRVGETPVSVELDPKIPYRVAIRRDKYRAYEGPLVFQGGKPVVVVASLVPAGSRGSSPRSGRSPRKPAHAHRIGHQKPGQPLAARPKGVPAGEVPVARPDKPVPRTAPRPAGKGKLMINSRPWARIFVDGRDTGLTTPQRAIPLSAGTHTVTLKNPKFSIDSSFPVVIRPNQATKVIKRFGK